MGHAAGPRPQAGAVPRAERGLDRRGGPGVPAPPPHRPRGRRLPPALQRAAAGGGARRVLPRGARRLLVCWRQHLRRRRLREPGGHEACHRLPLRQRRPALPRGQRGRLAGQRPRGHRRGGRVLRRGGACLAPGDVDVFRVAHYVSFAAAVDGLLPGRDSAEAAATQEHRQGPCAAGHVQHLHHLRALLYEPHRAGLRAGLALRLDRGRQPRRGLHRGQRPERLRPRARRRRAPGPAASRGVRDPLHEQRAEPARHGPAPRRRLRRAAAAPGQEVPPRGHLLPVLDRQRHRLRALPRRPGARGVLRGAAAGLRRLRGGRDGLA
mmetsp:Transcript_104431/g.295127  ORF Transcript_104431/g.295127 Transcript_104431/m.295127 type:complete len:323 (-) Transcript_104431:289-1257(-)